MNQQCKYKVGDAVVADTGEYYKISVELPDPGHPAYEAVCIDDGLEYNILESQIVGLVGNTPQENIQIQVGQKYFINDPWEMSLQENYSHGDIVEIEDVDEGGLGWFTREFFIDPHWVEQGYAQLVEDVNQKDLINSPSHYMLLPGVEVKDVRRAILDNAPDGIPYTQIDDWSRAWEYLTRMWGKNGLEDAKKAQVYLGWLIEKMENKNAE